MRCRQIKVPRLEDLEPSVDAELVAEVEKEIAEERAGWSSSDHSYPRPGCKPRVVEVCYLERSDSSTAHYPTLIIQSR
jgi:hypothetical protein